MPASSNASNTITIQSSVTCRPPLRAPRPSRCRVAKSPSADTILILLSLSRNADSKLRRAQVQRVVGKSRLSSLRKSDQLREGQGGAENSVGSRAGCFHHGRPSPDLRLHERIVGLVVGC